MSVDALKEKVAPNRFCKEDEAIRQEALDPSRSFIVQAPAGSGKTGLLTQRFLKLLSKAKEVPEECLAITFTRKAAAEMRNRIIEALQRGENPIPPEEAYERQYWRLAREVLKRDERLGWHLIQNPNRLKILTIDALCASLTRQLPLLSELGASLSVSEEPWKWYQMAARQLLATLDTEEPMSSSLQVLLVHLDNNLALAEQLLANMLSNRDQWLAHIGRAASEVEMRNLLERGLEYAIEEALLALKSVMPKGFEEILPLAKFAASQLETLDKSSLIIHCKNLSDRLPGTKVSDLNLWQALGALLLTEDNEFRKTVTERQGFPSFTKAIDSNKAQFKLSKQKMIELLEKFAKEETFRQALETVRRCPEGVYEETQWQVVQALVTVLPVLVAQLSLVFQEQGQVDFIEIALAALRALGDTESPTDLALSLDYKIQHILVDEFQDTSIPQFRLLEQLTAGFEPLDGRTLFLVGDPMQSIYRFRQAEVSLFIRAKEKGMGSIVLKPLTLTTNFRSDPAVVDWVNQQFQTTFPKQDNSSVGAIAYSPSKAAQKRNETARVEVHPVSLESEASKVLELVQAIRTHHPAFSVALLVRSRSHLQSLLPVLKKANIEYEGVQLERLKDCLVVRDLVALTRALLHLGDRIAWLAIFQTPWCYLSLQDLYLLSQSSPSKPFWQALMRYDQILGLSEAAKTTLSLKVPILKKAIQQRGRLSLREFIMDTWLLLGGAEYFYTENSISEAETFFTLLENESLDFNEPGVLETHLDTLYAKPKAASSTPVLQIMTIHKAKGLEFDAVIVPGIGRKIRHDPSQLLLWAERTRSKDNQSYLVLAPIKSVGSEQDPIYYYLKKEEEQRGHYESLRLWYVAATRARKQLYWLTHTAKDHN